MTLTGKQKRFCDEYLNNKSLNIARISSGMHIYSIPGDKYFVYILTDPTNDEIFYIGKGIRNRPFDHLKEAKGSNNSNVFKCNRIREILAMGEDVGVSYLAINLNEDEAYQVESAFIKRIGTANLTNISGGLNKESARERALFNLSRLKPYDKWLAGRPNATEFEKELYWKVKSNFEEIASRGYIYKIIEKVANGKSEVIEKRRM